MKNNHNRFSSFILKAGQLAPIIYFILVYVPYFVGADKTLMYWLSLSTFAAIYRIVVSMLFVIFVVVYMFVRKEKYQLSIFISFFLYAVFFAVGAFIVPQTISQTFYIDYNKVIVESTLHIGLEDRIVGLFNTIFDLFFAFYLIFFGKSMFTKKSVLYLMEAVLLISVVECALTFVMDRGDYALLLSGSFSNIYSINISGTFQSKNGLGMFLFQGILAACYVLAVERKKYIRVMTYISALLILLVLLISLCKTSFVVSALTFVSYVLIAGFKDKKTRKLTIILTVSALALAGLAVGIAFVPVVREKLHLDSIINQLNQSIVNTLDDRMRIWAESTFLFKSPYLFFGYSKGCSSLILRLIDGTLNSSLFHNGFLCVLANFGLIGLMSYLCLLYYAIRQIFTKMGKHYSQIKLMVIITFISAIAYSMFESIYIIASGSAIVMLQNFVIIIVPFLYEDELKEGGRAEDEKKSISFNRASISI